MEKIYLFFLESTVRDIESLNTYKKDVFCTWHHRFQNGQGITRDIICEKYRTVKDAMEGKKEGIEIGALRMLVKQIKKGRLTIEEAAEDAAMSVEEFRKVMESNVR